MTLLRDLRYGCRILVRYPSYALAAAAVVALGVGASTAVFAVVRGVLIRPLPYRDVDRLVTFRADAAGFNHAPALTAEEFAAIRGLTDIFEDAATANSSPASLTGVDDMERVMSASISDGFLPLFGVAPALGRQVTARQDVGPTWVHGVDISYELWQRRWHGDPAILGRDIEVNNLKMTVAGVMPRGFRLYLGEGAGVAPLVDVWFPGAPDVGTARSCPVVARLRPGITTATAQAALDTFVTRFIREHPRSYPAGGVRLTIAPLMQDVARTIRPALLAFSAAVGFVLLVACANLTNLLLARASVRTRELAVRTAIGASRAQLVQQLAIESFVIAAVGTAAGVLVAEWARDALLALAPASLPRREDIVLDGVVFAFAASAAFMSSLIFGLIPAWHATRAEVIATMKQDPGSPGAGRMRGLLVASQLALSLMLLVGASLMARTFLRLHDVPLGFDPSGVMTIRTDLPFQRFNTPERREAFFAAAVDAARQVPGVEAVAFGLPIPLSGVRLTRSYSLGPGEPERVASAVVALPGYAEFLRVPLRAGRYIAREDRGRDVAALMADEGLAALVWPGENAIGKRLLLSPSSRAPRWGEVVGVVGRVRMEGLRGEAAPQLWVSYDAMPYGADLAFRTRSNGREVAAAVKRTVERLGPGRPLFAVRALDDYVADAAADARFASLVLGLFAVVAVVLSAIGVYGVVAYATARRTREIAVRLALGAERSRIVALVVREGALWIALGIGLGLAGAAVLSQYLGSLLFEINRYDPLTFSMVALLLTIFAFVATALPALRAVCVDPMLSLRAD
jgi:putative ABC transport system permease protein